MSYVECRIDGVKETLREGLFSYVASSLIHAILFLALALMLGNIRRARRWATRSASRRLRLTNRWPSR